MKMGAYDGELHGTWGAGVCGVRGGRCGATLCKTALLAGLSSDENMFRQRAGGRNFDVRSSQCRAMHPCAGYRAVFIARAGDARGRRTDFRKLLE